ncbi:FAD-dependent monooxygenase [Streptomyces sp. H27-D2]|uniref:FAD-dependent monooxygenase n=1 Tax=Streptomyces sp. H27-D2 TaxID=3046304 RepID=UPI002DBA83EE|nr:FAD-dependent monooxygenase [Streptomyces sp. H27-D2]MEC4015892.1 FAD-dependent monooxygenase [Streptomyces sp. H27-D2]
MDPVIVVGAGPVGLTLALALAHHDVPSVVLDAGAGPEPQRPARTVVLRPDTAEFLDRLGCGELRTGGARWTAWRTMRRHQLLAHVPFADDASYGSLSGPLPGPLSGSSHGSRYGAPYRASSRGEAAEDATDAARAGGEPLGIAGPAAGSAGSAGDDVSGAGAEQDAAPVARSPLHVSQHALTRALRAALAGHDLVRIVPGSRLDSLEQDAAGLTAHTRGPNATWWRGSYLVGCDGPRSTVRKLLDVRFPGRTAVERHAVAALRTSLPWPGEALLHRSPARRGAVGPGGEVSARPLTGGVWRLDWLLPPRGDLVTPEALLGRIRDTLSGWCDPTGDTGGVPPYELLDTGVHTVHHRLARRWREGRAFLAGDAAHLLGALGTQGLDEGLRDAENLAWKLGLAWHHGASDTLLDSYQAERRGAVAARLRAADQVLPILRGTSGWRTVRRSVLPGAVRGHATLLTDGHLGRGPLGAPPRYGRSPLAASTDLPSFTLVGTAPGAPVEDVPVTCPDGSADRLRERLGRDLLVLLVAPGTGVWERRHWLTAGVMPRLAAAVTALPVRAELLVAEGYPGAAAHTVLLIRPDGHLVAALSGVRPAELYSCADAVRGGLVEAPARTPG